MFLYFSLCVSATFHSAFLCYILILPTHNLNTEARGFPFSSVNVYSTSYLAWNLVFSKTTFRLVIFGKKDDWKLIAIVMLSLSLSSEDAGLQRTVAILEWKDWGATAGPRKKVGGPT